MRQRCVTRSTSSSDALVGTVCADEDEDACGGGGGGGDDVVVVVACVVDDDDGGDSSASSGCALTYACRKASKWSSMSPQWLSSYPLADSGHV